MQKTQFELLMYYYFPPNSSIKVYPGPIEIHEVLIKYAPQKIYYISLSKIIEALHVLPASEASAERIFAQMHDLFNKKQTRIKKKMLSKVIPKCDKKLKFRA